MSEDMFLLWQFRFAIFLFMCHITRKSSKSWYHVLYDDADTEWVTPSEKINFITAVSLSFSTCGWILYHTQCVIKHCNANYSIGTYSVAVDTKWLFLCQRIHPWYFVCVSLVFPPLNGIQFLPLPISGIIIFVSFKVFMITKSRWKSHKRQNYDPKKAIPRYQCRRGEIEAEEDR